MIAPEHCPTRPADPAASWSRCVSSTAWQGQGPVTHWSTVDFHLSHKHILGSCLYFVTHSAFETLAGAQGCNPL